MIKEAVMDTQSNKNQAGQTKVKKDAFAEDGVIQ